MGNTRKQRGELSLEKNAAGLICEEKVQGVKVLGIRGVRWGERRIRRVALAGWDIG